MLKGLPFLPITWTMPIEDVVSRIAAIEALAARAQAAVSSPGGLSTAAQSTPFTTTLQDAITLPATASTTASPEVTGRVLSGDLRSLSSLDPTTLSSPGRRALLAAQAEIGVRETPYGSNNAPRISEYRTATTGSAPGVPWCAYFVSWAARQAGAPIGEQGQGYGAVEQIASWAERTGRLVPPGTPPEPGDLILFGGRHVGIVESVGTDGRLTTVEGNHRNSVQRVERTLGEATGFVRLS
jgi:CHAP domain